MFEMSLDRWMGMLLGVALAVGTLGARALAEEPRVTSEERLAVLGKLVAAHKRAHDANGMLDDIRQLVALYRDAQPESKVRAGTIRLIGGLTRNGKGTRVPETALAALGKTGDPAGARYVAAHLKRVPRKGRASDALRAAVSAAAKIRADALVEPLLELVDESRDCALAASAVTALGHFGRNKRKRVKILRSLVESTAKDRPGAKGRSKPHVDGDQYRHTGDRARNRWQSLSRVLPAALTRLTGDDMGRRNAVEWIELVRENKRRLGALFTEAD